MMMMRTTTKESIKNDSACFACDVTSGRLLHISVEFEKLSKKNEGNVPSITKLKGGGGEEEREVLSLVAS